jgi:hypothetical protein
MRFLALFFLVPCSSSTIKNAVLSQELIIECHVGNGEERREKELKTQPTCVNVIELVQWFQRMNDSFSGWYEECVTHFVKKKKLAKQFMVIVIAVKCMTSF